MTSVTDTAPTLVADIGGTNTRVALATGQIVHRETVRKFSNAEYGSLTDVLQTYIDVQKPGHIAAACVALAGPVQNGVAKMTNLNWTLDLPSLRQVTGAAKVLILNDLQAQGFAIGHVKEEEVVTIWDAGVAPNGPMLAMNIGTGFNVAPVYDFPDRRFVAPAESGAMRLPAASPTEEDLVRFLDKKTGFAAVEEALSGRGLAQIYDFFAQGTDDPKGFSPAEVMNAALEHSNKSAKETLALFLTLSARIAGDLAFSYQPLGGIYFVGGVAQKIAHLFDAKEFSAAFHDKGRFVSMINSISVFAICDDFSALTGAAVAISQENEQ